MIRWIKCHKVYAAALVLLLFMVLPACSAKEKADGSETLKIQDYLPMQENAKYVYEGIGNEFAGYETYVDYLSKGVVQQSIQNGGTSMVRVYQVKDGKLVRTFSKGEIYYRDDFRNRKDNSEEVLLMEPIKKGTTWKTGDGKQRTITGISSEISVPMRTFSAIEVVTEGTDGTNIDYYAKNVGLVKTIFRSGGMEVSSSLKAVEKNTARIQQVRFYYPEKDSGTIKNITKDVEFHTNDNTGEILEEAYKAAVDQTYGVVLPTGAAIKTLALDQEGRVRLDMGKTFPDEIKRGSIAENLVLQCIADTFGNYYGSDEVIFTAEGEPYAIKNVKRGISE